MWLFVAPFAVGLLVLEELPKHLVRRKRCERESSRARAMFYDRGAQALKGVPGEERGLPPEPGMGARGVAIGRVMLLIGVFVIVGVPIVAVLWDAINHVVTGELGRLVVALPALAAFIVFLFVLGNRIRRLE